MNPSPTVKACLFWIDDWWSCLPTSEWSGWAQAAGATAALFITIWLWRRSLAREDRRARAGFIAFADAVCMCLYRLAKAPNIGEQDIQTAILGEALHAARGVPLVHLKSGFLQSGLMSVLGIAKAMHELGSAIHEESRLSTVDERARYTANFEALHSLVVRLGLPTKIDEMLRDFAAAEVSRVR